MLNVVCIMGRMVFEPELKQTPSGTSVITFRIAHDRSKGEDKQVDYIDVVAWRGTAEFVSKYVKKGSLVAVTGSLQTRSYEDKAGNKRTVYEVLASNVYFAENRRKDENKASTAQLDAEVDFEEITDDEDDLPF